MIRKLLFPTLAAGLAAALLGGCVTGYDYRGGNGDYYYGQPSVEYRDYGYGGYGGYGDPHGGYGYPGGWSGSIGYGGGYGGYGGYGRYGYPYGYGGYGYPFWYGGYGTYIQNHHHRPPPVIVVPPGGSLPGDNGGNGGNDDDNDGDGRVFGPPRRDPDLRRSQLPGAQPSIQPQRPMFAVPVPRQERINESRVQPSRPRVSRERDDGRSPTP